MTLLIGKLGRQPFEVDDRDLMAVDFLDLERPRVPLDRSWDTFTTGRIPEFLNRELGCCVVSGIAHSLRVCSAAAGHQIVVSDDDILEAYKAISGYVPGRPETDKGATCRAGLKHAFNVGIGGHKLAAYYRIKTDDYRADQARLAALEISGSVYGGYDLPLSAKSQDVWDVPEGGPVGPGLPRSWGGHAMPYSTQGPFTRKVKTWGRDQLITGHFDRTYGAEHWLLVWQAWLDETGQTPAGLDWDKTIEAVKSVTV